GGSPLGRSYQPSVTAVERRTPSPLTLLLVIERHDARGNRRAAPAAGRAVPKKVESVRPFVSLVWVTPAAESADARPTAVHVVRHLAPAVRPVGSAGARRRAARPLRPRRRPGGV